MPSIDGRLEWDDDELTPGKKREGGLHHNLYDSQGALTSSARFIPGQEQDEREPQVVFVYQEVAEPEKTPEQIALEKAVSEQLDRLVGYAIATLAPHAIRFWAQRAQPALRSTLSKARAKASRKERDEPTVPSPATASSLDRAREPRNWVEMTDDEAQARYLLALAARAFSDEQLSLLAAAHPYGVDFVAELERASAALPADEAALLLAALADRPALAASRHTDSGELVEAAPVDRERARRALPVQQRTRGDRTR